MVKVNNGYIVMLPLFEDQDGDLIKLIQDKTKEAEANSAEFPPYNVGSYLIDLIRTGIDTKRSA